jgi:membrane-bound lytic murein transglycosylase B
VLSVESQSVLRLKRPAAPISNVGAVHSVGQIVRACLVTMLFVCAFFVLLGQRAHAQTAAETKHFQAFVAHLWPDAQHLGVSRSTFDAAFKGIGPDPLILAKTQKQAEFVKPLGDYLASAVSQARIDRGQKLGEQWGDVLSRIEAEYGVDRFIVLAVWGVESNFGSFAGSIPVIQALATLADGGYRTPYFRSELLKALVILENKHVALADFNGSWAGAMGQTQFMPSSFLNYAVDFDGDGRKDIWTSVPDALASTAHYLSRHGWVRDMTWGYEVFVPPFADVASLGAGDYHNLADWASLGVTRADGGAMPRDGEAMLVQPAGVEGPAFLVTSNFRVIRSYNNSLAYALGVALLSDRIAGFEPLRGTWPVAAR